MRAKQIVVGVWLVVMSACGEGPRLPPGCYAAPGWESDESVMDLCEAWDPAYPVHVSTVQLADWGGFPEHWNWSNDGAGVTGFTMVNWPAHGEYNIILRADVAADVIEHELTHADLHWHTGDADYAHEGEEWK